MAQGKEGMKGRRWLWGVGALICVSLTLVATGVWWFIWGPGASDNGASQELLLPPEVAELALGRSVYRASCAPCHGPQGEGAPDWQEQNPDGTFPPPPHDSSGHTWHHSDDFLYRVIRDGGQFLEEEYLRLEAELGEPLKYGYKNAMPAFANCLSPEEIRAVISYLKSLWGPVERAFQEHVSALSNQ